MTASREAVARAIDPGAFDPFRCAPDEQREDALLMADAAIAAYEASLRAEGFVVVPREPTEAMIDAAEALWRERLIDKARRGAFGEDGTRKPFVLNWHAMLAERPKP